MEISISKSVFKFIKKNAVTGNLGHPHFRIRLSGECEDSIEDMSQSLRNNDVIGLSGSRVFVRNLLSELVDSLNARLGEDRYLDLAHNHPDTELGYAFSMNELSSSEALSKVLKEYDRKNLNGRND